MAEIAIPLGKEARLYYGQPNDAVTCTTQAATLESAGVECSGIQDCTITIEKDDTECSRRSSHGWEDTRESIKRMNISFNLPNVYDGGVEAAAIVVLRNTFISGTYNAAAVASGICFYALASKAAVVTDEPGPQAIDGDGICADFILTKFERNEPFSETQSYNVEGKLTQCHGRTPKWV